MESNWTKTILDKGWITLRRCAPKAQDDATPLTEDYEERDNKFTDRLDKVKINCLKQAPLPVAGNDEPNNKTTQGGSSYDPQERKAEYISETVSIVRGHRGGAGDGRMRGDAATDEKAIAA